jgi:glycolate oxidase
LTIVTGATVDVADPVLRRQLAADLRQLLPAHCVLDRLEQLKPFECDALTAIREIPLLVVLPENRQQVQAVVQYAHKNAVALIARGAGTGLSGGATPRADAVLLVLSKLNSILEIDADSRVAVVEPGVRNLAISEAVAGLGLFYAPDPSSQVASSIGGNVAENSGGVHCVKYGLTTHNIRQIRYFDYTGELVTLGGAGLDAPGYDLMALMTGSEGMLGVVVEITVNLLPLPESIVLLQAAFPAMDQAGLGVMNIIAAGIIPAGLEMMDQTAIEVVENYIHMDLPLDAEAILLIELDGTEAEVESQLVSVTAEIEKYGAYDLRLARSEQDRIKLWSGRKSAFPALGQVTTDFYIMDATVPRRHLPYALRQIVELSSQYRLRVANVFHAGDGNLHPLVLYDASDPDQVARTEQLADEILTVCLSLGGTLSGEHGIGREKLDKSCDQFSTVELEQFERIKRVFDPDGRLNPGKAIPTPQRCAEIGGMHVHQGRVPFPELERF